MERRLWPSTVALALVLGTVAASAQTRRPAEHNQNPPQATQSPNEPHADAPSGAGAPNATAPQAQQNTQQNMPAQPNLNAPQPGRSDANTQAQPQQGMPAQGQAQGQAQPGMPQGNTAGATTGNANAQPNANQNADVNANPQGNQQGVITLTEQQNKRVATAIRQANVQPLTNVSFSIAVGTTVPADVQVHVLPPALVEIVPQYRGFSFVVVEQEALIIDPNTRAIVAVMPFAAQQTTGAAAAPPPPQAAAPAPAPAQGAAPPPRERKKTDLTRDQRRQAERHRKHEKSEKSVTI